MYYIQFISFCRTKPWRGVLHSGSHTLAGHAEQAAGFSGGAGQMQVARARRQLARSKSETQSMFAIVCMFKV